MTSGPMQRKAPMPFTESELDGLFPLVRAYVQWSQLKQLYRQGWLRRGIPPERCESVAEHSFGVALLTLMLVDSYFPDLDRQLAVEMALLHDLGEVYAGDLTPGDGVLSDEKHRRERASVSRVLAGIDHGEEYVALWEEYENGETPEARLVRQADRLEMGLQAYLYEVQEGADLTEFRTSVDEALSLPALSRLFRQVEKLRE